MSRFYPKRGDDGRRTTAFWDRRRMKDTVGLSTFVFRPSSFVALYGAALRMVIGSTHGGGKLPALSSTTSRKAYSPGSRAPASKLPNRPSTTGLVPTPSESHSPPVPTPLISNL